MYKEIDRLKMVITNKLSNRQEDKDRQVDRKRDGYDIPDESSTRLQVKPPDMVRDTVLIRLALVKGQTSCEADYKTLFNIFSSDSCHQLQMPSTDMERHARMNK